MTLILEPSTCSTPARRRATLAAPVLIRVPALSGSAVAGRRTPVRRRRLRREVRVAGFWLLALIPTVVACATWGSTRPAPLLAVNSPDRPAAEVAFEARDQGRSTISLRLEPVLAAAPTPEFAGGPVFFSGQLLPADTTEEPSHGGY